MYVLYLAVASCVVLRCLFKGPCWDVGVCNTRCWRGLDGASSHAQWVSIWCVWQGEASRLHSINVTCIN